MKSLTLADPYVWIDPGDVIFLQAHKEALKMERGAYELCHAERVTCLQQRAASKAAVNAAWHYLQSPQSYSADEREYVFRQLDGARDLLGYDTLAPGTPSAGLGDETTPHGDDR